MRKAIPIVWRESSKERIRKLQDLGTAIRETNRALKEDFSKLARYCPYKTCVGGCRLLPSGLSGLPGEGSYYFCGVEHCPFIVEGRYPIEMPLTPL